MQHQDFAKRTEAIRRLAKGARRGYNRKRGVSQRNVRKALPFCPPVDAGSFNRFAERRWCYR